MPYLIKRLNYSFFRKKIFRREVEASFYSNRKFKLPVVHRIKETKIEEFKKDFPFRFFNDINEFNTAKMLFIVQKGLQ